MELFSKNKINKEREQLEDKGYIIVKNFFNKEYLTTQLKFNSQLIFFYQFKKFNYPICIFGKNKIDENLFKENMIRLFNEHEEVFKNCGKLIQTGLHGLYSKFSDPDLWFKLQELGLQYPVGCTRPVLFFNHLKLAKSKEYYKSPLHQDWPSMEASQNSLVVWVPLVDVNKENGSIILYPGSHKQGILPFKTNGGFAEVEYEGESVQPEMKVGDIAIFSTKLVHKSGDISNDTIRWSCHFRYTDMLEDNFIGRGFPSPYEYKPKTKM